MDAYLLDTDISINFLRGRFNIKEKINEVGISSCSVSEITIFELTYGAYKSSNFEKHIEEVDKVSQLFKVLPINNCYSKYAEERVKLEKAGLRIPDFDLLIGSTAVINNLVLFTNNEAHLSRINGIIIENWMKPVHNKYL